MATAVQRVLHRQLSRRMLMSASTSFLGYGLQALLARGVVPDVWLAGWVLSVAAAECANAALALALGRAVERVDAGKWQARALAVGLLICSTLWGCSILLPGVRGSYELLLMQGIVLVVAGIMSVHNLSSHAACLATFGLGLAGPMVVLWLFGKGVPQPLGLGALAMLVICQVYGWTTRKLLVEATKVQLENERITAELQSSNEELNATLQRLNVLASTDTLTTCLNRRSMSQDMEREFGRYKRYGTRFGLLMLDLDHFKSINDRFGHGIGDLVLTDTANKLLAQMRSLDRVSRWGGEEFLCLLGHLKDEEALVRKAELIRSSIENNPIATSAGEVWITASIGIAMIEADQSIDDLISQADKALYLAKSCGRNRVSFWRETGERSS